MLTILKLTLILADHFTQMYLNGLHWLCGAMALLFLLL